MVIGSAQLEITTDECNSLKEKRSIINSIKARVHNKYNVAIAEVDFADTIYVSVLGVVTVANDEKFVNGVLNTVVDFIERYYPGRIADYGIQIDHH
jgi:uncharacterized protein